MTVMNNVPAGYTGNTGALAEIQEDVRQRWRLRIALATASNITNML